MGTNQVHADQKVKRQRKFFVLLPILVLPFITLAGWASGIIGKKQIAVTKTERGININLPAANPVQDSAWNKLKFYEHADQDSARRKSQLASDPYYRLPVIASDTNSRRNTGSRYSYDPYPDANEEKVYSKIAQLDRELQRSSISGNPTGTAPIPGNIETGGDINRLEQMLHSVSSEPDPQINQLNGMLDKILDIQHPQRMKDRIRETSEKNGKIVYPVEASMPEPTISLLGITKDTIPPGSGFFSIDPEPENNIEDLAIPANIPFQQVVVSGATLRLVLDRDIYIRGILIPRNTNLYGTTSLNGDRLAVTINTIRYGNNIFPVSLSVYDTDGMQGINIPGSISREVAKNSADQAIQSLDINSLDPSLGAQAASAGIQTAKTIIGRKTKLIRFTIKAGHEVLLIDNNGR